MTYVGVTINLINQFLVAFVTIALSWKCFQLKLQRTAMHAYLCTLGFVCLFAEGLMVRYNNNPFTAHLAAESKMHLQFVLQLVGGILGIAGTIHKIKDKKTHFLSLHAKWGLAACLFCFVNFIYGFLALYSPYYRDYFSSHLTNFVHNFLGVVTFATAMLAQFYGYDTGFFSRNYKNKELYKFLTIVIFILTALLPCQVLIKRVYNILV